MNIFTGLEIVYSWIAYISIYLLLPLILVKQENVLLPDILLSCGFRIALIILLWRHAGVPDAVYMNDREILGIANQVLSGLIIIQILVQAKTLLHLMYAAGLFVGELYLVVGGGWQSQGVYWAVGVTGFLCISIQWVVLLRAPLRPWAARGLQVLKTRRRPGSPTALGMNAGAAVLQDETGRPAIAASGQ